ncbi:hypothetical protein OG21DRAFT_1373993, partial [Imleria badia]
YPFASLDDWEMANFLLTSRLSMNIIDNFLSMPAISKELCSWAELLPSGPQWQFQIIPTTHETKRPVHLYFHDALDCVELLFSHPYF